MFSVIKKVLPDAYELLLKRKQILEVVNREGPIGRRRLSEKVNLTERSTRNEVNVLNKQGLILTTQTGMKLTNQGLELLEELDLLLDQDRYLLDLEKRLATYLTIKACRIVPGNVDADLAVQSLMANKAIEVMDQLLDTGKQTVTVMGGTTLNEVANHMDQTFGANRDLLFVPARGGLGDDAVIEANIIAQKMAEQTGGHAHGLYVPGHVHESTQKELLKEPEIKKTLLLIEKSALVLYSIGTSTIMGKRRGLNEETRQFLEEQGAVAEAFGEFINEQGEIVLKLPNIGLQSSSLNKIENVLTVAGGRNKALAISSYLKTAPSHTILITDEAAAKEILNGGHPLK